MNTKKTANNETPNYVSLLSDYHFYCFANDGSASGGCGSESF